ncbi:MAG: c-type cytochrome biogenesis protein CcmI [Candidatus Rokubacteria bacterium]|nr:c-type cytochrome biogenesis protein CcmI [Candidatus Rokubacteria bacterium]MBI2554889.1 c-type cytochrome biogenesis protein CcmI [Candidatus Rokubacteria bacterium]
MTVWGVVAIVVIALPALAFILWPLLRRGTAPGGILPIPQDRRDELDEEKRAIYRALKELEFDYQAGHLSEDDYAELRSRYEGRAAQVLKELDALPPRPEKAEPRGAKRDAVAPPARGWTRSPMTLIVGATVLVLFGLTLGLGVARYTEPDRTMVPEGSRLPVTIEAPQAFGTMPATDPSRPIPPEVFRGMLDAAHQALDAGQYQQAIAAYQAVLKRDPKNVEAITHLGVILSIAGHDDSALEAFDKALAIDPNYIHAHWDKARVLYESKKDYKATIQALEKFVALTPGGEDRERALRMIQDAKGQLGKSKP